MVAIGDSVIYKVFWLCYFICLIFFLQMGNARVPIPAHRPGGMATSATMPPNSTVSSNLYCIYQPAVLTCLIYD